MAISKVVFGTTVLVDLTSDTVAADKLLSVYTAHGKDGQSVAGSFVPAAVSGTNLILNSVNVTVG